MNFFIETSKSSIYQNIILKPHYNYLIDRDFIDRYIYSTLYEATGVVLLYASSYTTVQVSAQAQRTWETYIVSVFQTA